MAKMERFCQIFKRKACNIIGMIHVEALPGTPRYGGNWMGIIEKAIYEANIYKKFNLDSVLIENMHDVPYVQSQNLLPETTACMCRISNEIRKILPQYMPVGLQILACGNREALAIAKACNLQYIRAEGFVYGHIGDEGYINANAGLLLRYRQQIDANQILILTDIKKKHSAHAITADVSLMETAKAAAFFLSDGIILTGNFTGDPVKLEDINFLRDTSIKVPLIIGSGVTTDNIRDYYKKVHAVIIGSHFKKQGLWSNDLCEYTIQKFMEEEGNLRSLSNSSYFNE